jgi:chloramphenicol 3-O phosphotransferase
MINKKIIVISGTIFLLIGIFMNRIHNNRTKIQSGMVIILNGPSSVGKSSIIKAFQQLNKNPWLSIGIDNFFVGVLPPKFYLEDTPEHHTVMHGIPSIDAQGNKVFTLVIGQEGQKVIKGMHRAIAAYAQSGNNIIVDYINYDPLFINDLKNTLQGIHVIWIGVHASLESIEQREKARGTSPQGHARSHYATVHQGINYDLQLDTDTLTPSESAQIILDKIINP